MSSSLRPGEITYYEELGVENTASSDEIRDAFRALVRLLHPDQQSDPLLRETAERQMRKVNRIYSVLSDPARRTAYDQSLNAPRNAPVIVFSGSDGTLKKLIVRGAAVATIVGGSFLLLWFMVMSNNNNTEIHVQDAHAASGKTSDSPDDAGDQMSRLRDQLRAVETERDSAYEQLGRLGGKTVDHASSPKTHAGSVRGSSTPATATTLAELPEVAAPASMASAPPAPGGEQTINASQFAGLWVLAKSIGSASPGGQSQYPPEFVDLTVTERNGALHGQYHSRYQVLDHAISPDVDFIFSGTPRGSALSCAWQGPGGAKGRLTLKLLPASTVEVAWNATELGTQQWLINGTATLTRK